MPDRLRSAHEGRMLALDALSPSERHLPPSMRVWAREILADTGFPRLELRDLNDGQDPYPARKTRHQYVVSRGYLWRRRLPPAPLDHPEDETPWRDRPLQWETVDLVALGRSSLLSSWASAQDRDLRRPLREPVRRTAERNPDGRGRAQYTIYAMPPRDPWDHWADITSSEGTPVPCPVPGCAGHLLWYEAGYVPGYRVCMRPTEGGYDPETIRHQFVPDHDGDECAGPLSLILLGRRGKGR